MSITAHDHDWELRGDPERVIAQLFLPGESLVPARPRAEVIYDRVDALPDALAEQLGQELIDEFAPRHHDIRATLEAHAHTVLRRIGQSESAESPSLALLGATFTMEYAVEAAAVSNPSAILHPDQSGLAPGQARVALSLRQIGEGHVSSIGFATALIGPGETWLFEEREGPLRLPRIAPTGKSWSTYRATFAEDSSLSQRVLMPVIKEELNGVEDARLVRFDDGDGVIEYRATYTAYDGAAVLPRLLTSPDLVRFTSHPLTGPAAVNKGVALFPRRIDGELYALVRSDGETISIAHSPDGLAWGREIAIRAPELAWELVLSGNCGSPIELPEGWLLLTHGVGPMRRYGLGAMLLDLDDPTRVLGVLEEPLLTAMGSRQPGYVPNVVYTCGGLVHDGILWIPYGVGDNRVRVASIEVDALLAAMR